MTFVDSLLSTPADDGFHVLISLAMWSVIVLSIAWLITGCMRRTSAATRCCVWQFAIVVVLLIPTLRSFVPGIPLGWRTRAIDVATVEPRDRIDFSQNSEENALDDSEASRSKPVASNTAAAATPQKTTSPQSTVPSNQPITELEQSVEATYLPTAHMSWSNVILTIWTIGVLGNLCWLVCSVMRARRLVRSATTDVDVRLKAMLTEVTEQMSWRQPIRLSESPRVRVPLVMGPFRPRIVMPVEWANWSPARIRIVLSHEVAHVVRRDVAWQLVTRLAAALYWINPLVWLAVRKVRTERETACDDVVLLAGVTATDYAAGLVEMAAELGGQRLNLLGAMGMAEQPRIKKRLQAILNDRSCRTPVSRHMRRVFLLGATSLAISLAMLRPFDSVAGGTDKPDKKQVSQKEPVSPLSDDTSVSKDNKLTKKSKEPLFRGDIPATPIEEAVKQFNMEMATKHRFDTTWPRQRVVLKERRPKRLTVDEVLRAIRNYDWSGKDNIDPNTPGIYQKIVETRILPPRSKLEFRDWWRDPIKSDPSTDDKFEHRYWEVFLHVMTAEKRGIGLPIRKQELDKRIALRPEPGYSFVVRPFSPHTRGNYFGGEEVLITDKHPNGGFLITVGLTKRLLDGAEGNYRGRGPIRQPNDVHAVAFDAEGKRYPLKWHRGAGATHQFWMMRFMLDPLVLDPADAQFIGIEALREKPSATPEEKL